MIPAKLLRGITNIFFFEDFQFQMTDDYLTEDFLLRKTPFNIS